MEGHIQNIYTLYRARDNSFTTLQNFDKNCSLQEYKKTYKIVGHRAKKTDEYVYIGTGGDLEKEYL